MFLVTECLLEYPHVGKSKVFFTEEELYANNLPNIFVVYNFDGIQATEENTEVAKKAREIQKEIKRCSPEN